MTPLDPKTPVDSEDKSAKLPMPGEDRLAEDLVNEGIEEAENELRDTANDEADEEARDVRTPLG